MRTKVLSMALGILVAGLGCTADPTSGNPAACDPDLFPGDSDCVDRAGGEAGKGDAWNSTNDPQRWARDLNYYLEQLPMSGQSERIAWASTYWPYTDDSTNVRWMGADVLSPMEKYDAAFNGWDPARVMGLRPLTRCGGTYDQSYYDNLGPAAKWISENKGNYAFRDGRDSDGDGMIDECNEDYDGIETWWGLCHAWVPAAVLEDEPLHAVTYNGQTFEVGDIHALLITAYDSSEALMLGGRCNEMITDRPANNLRDDSLPSQCRDTNPGAFHVIVGNFIGLRRQAIAEDRTFDYQVWNQPLVGYEVTRQEEIDLAAANGLLGLTGDTYTPNPNASRWFEVELTTDYITESSATREPTSPVISRYTRHDRYHYILELTADGKIVGGEWVGGSRFNHPDFLWLPIRASRWGNNPHVDLAKAQMLRDLARRDDSGGGDGGGSGYVNTTPVEIPDNNPAGAASIVNVPDSVGIQRLAVRVEIEHTYIGDLRVELQHGGTSVILHNNEGGSTDNIARTYDIGDFAGMDAMGEWRLHVVDSAGADTGRITRFGLEVTTGTSPPPPPSMGTEFSNTTPVMIPDNSTTGVTSTVSVSALTVANLTVSVDIEHPYIGDLQIELSHGGTTAMVHDRTGGSTDNLVRSFDLSDFNGSDASGTWTLTVRDTAADDVGTLNNWKLSFNR